MNGRFDRALSSKDERPPWRIVASASLLLGFLGGCAGRPPVVAAPNAMDCPVLTQGSGFRAGFGRADLTTPPGPGLFGFGPEAQAARGYRQRIHARAVVLQDARGERVALVAADLGFISGVLHRATAEIVQRCTELGPDRIIISATHTHAAPGHFAAHNAYDLVGSSVAGYDPAVIGFFAGQIAHSILDAMVALRPARAAWGIRPVWGITRIRSWAAHEALAHGRPTAFEPPAGLPDEQGHVDPTLAILRVDTVGAAGAAPAGVYSMFTAHGTGNPSANDLIDADAFAGVQRLLEQHIDSANGLAPAFRRRAVALMANGAEGDVVILRDTTACVMPLLRRAHRTGDFRTPPAPEVWSTPARAKTTCLGDARVAMGTFGDRLGREAIAVFDSLGGVLADDLEVSLAFEMVALRGPTAVPGLCPRGRNGSATVVGAETGHTRLAGWKLFGLFGLGFEEGGSAVRPSGDCHSPKRTFFPAVERVVAGAHPYEEAAQLAVLRLGSMLLGTVPFETTTTAGARIRAALMEATAKTPHPPRHVLLIGLSNGYLHYVTTREEYALQRYEGASTLYGPNSATVFTGRLTQLAKRLAMGAWVSPAPDVKPFPTFPSRPKVVMPRRREPGTRMRREVRTVECAGDTAILRWYDAPPGALFPADGQLVAIDARSNGAWTEIAWDDDPMVEVRGLRHAKQGYVWEVRWHRGGVTGTYRFRLLRRGTIPELSSTSFRAAGGTCLFS